MFTKTSDVPLVSVIIASYNSKETIRQCLNSLFSQKLEEGFYEVIVVDSSEDETPKIIQECFPDVKLVRLQNRTYPGTARNIGLKYAQGKIIAFIDSDCVTTQGWLTNIVKAHRSDFLAIGGSILNGRPENPISWTEYFLSASEYFPNAPRRFVRTIPTCNISYKREVFEKYGSFPDTAALEDALFNERLAEYGQPVLFEPTIRVYHLYRQTLRKLIAHEVKGGRIFKQVSFTSKTKGWFLARIPLLTPLFPFIKLALITIRLLKWNRPLFPKFLFLLPQVLLCLIASTYGILTGKGKFH